MTSAAIQPMNVHPVSLELRVVSGAACFTTCIGPQPGCPHRTDVRAAPDSWAAGQGIPGQRPTRQH